MNKTQLRRLKRNRSKIKSSNKGLRPRIVVSVSNKHTSAQLIDNSGIVVACYSSKQLKEFKGTGVETAREVGKMFSEQCKKVGKIDAVLDKGLKVYGGRLKSFAESCRECGINF